MDHSYIIDNTVLYCPVVQNHKSSKAHKKYFYIDSHRSDMKAKGNSWDILEQNYAKESLKNPQLNIPIL